MVSVTVQMIQTRKIAVVRMFFIFSIFSNVYIAFLNKLELIQEYYAGPRQNNFTLLLFENDVLLLIMLCFPWGTMS